jgi:hypothetical protein
VGSNPTLSAIQNGNFPTMAAPVDSGSWEEEARRTIGIDEGIKFANQRIRKSYAGQFKH